MENCVEHFEDGRDAWKLGVLGFFSRIRGIVTTLLFTLVTMGGAPFWWPPDLPSKLTFEIKYAFLVLPITFGTIFCALFYYLRERTKRSLDIKFYLHNLAHLLRDYQIKICKRKNSPQSRNARHGKKLLRKFSGKICDSLKDYFSTLLNDNSIEIAIRLAKEEVVEGENKIVYYTIARSSGFNKNRHKNSELICANEGIPGFFNKKDDQGILIYNDLKKASEVEAYKLTKNDKQYPGEVSTMMVAPLNGYDGNETTIIGLLYVTSRRKNVFSIIHVDSLKFTADLVAKSLSHAVNNL